MAHYYAKTKDGIEPRHFVSMTSRPDETRPTRLSDVRKWWKDGQQVWPSVTTILNVLDKPALTSWLVTKHLEAAYNEPPREFDKSDSYVKHVKKVAREEMDKAPSAGTDFHDLMEQYIKGNLSVLTIEQEHECMITLDAIEKATGAQDFSPEVYLMGDGYGGCADLVSRKWLIDYKTKLKGWTKPPKCHENHFMQLAAYKDALYQMGLVDEDCQTANVFVDLTWKHEPLFVTHTPEQQMYGLALFDACKNVWMIKNKVKGD